MYDLVLVDGNNRARAALSYKDAEVTVTFLKDLRKLMLKTTARCMVVLWDHPNADNYRRQIWPEYKTSRESDDEAREAIAACIEACRANDLPMWWDENFEADDLISTLAVKHPGTVLIYSSDKDLHRNISSRVSQLTLSLYNDDHKIMTPDRVFAEHKVTPSQWVDYYSLKGDSGDDVPGVRDIGKTTAQQLLAKFGSLEEIVRNCHNLGIQPKRAAAINQAIVDGTLAKMRRLVEARYAEIPESLQQQIDTWTNPWVDLSTLPKPDDLSSAFNE